MNILKALYPRRSLFGAFQLFISRVARYTPFSSSENPSKILSSVI